MFLTILLPTVFGHFESLSSWSWHLPEINKFLWICPGLHLAPCPNLTVSSDQHGTSRPSPASPEAGTARRHPTTAAGSHATRADHDTPDGGAILRDPGQVVPPVFAPLLLLSLTEEWPLHLSLPLPASTSPAYHHLRGMTANLETAWVSSPSVSCCSANKLANFPLRIPG